MALTYSTRYLRKGKEKNKKIQPAAFTIKSSGRLNRKRKVELSK